MDGLTQSYMFKERLLKCEPIQVDHGRFAVDLRERHLDDWALRGTLFWYASARAQQQTLHLSSMVRPSYKEGPGHTFAILPSQVHVT